MRYLREKNIAKLEGSLLVISETFFADSFMKKKVKMK